MPQGKVVITGANGFLGSAFLIDILQAGYTAHIVVRSEAKARSLQEAPAVTALNKASACHYFIVPDLTAPGALDAASAGADFIIHCATPVPFGLAAGEWDVTAPTVACTLGALESARAAGSVKRVIALSSLAAFASPELVAGAYEPADGEELVLGETPNEDIAGPYADPMSAYCAAKTAAFRRAREWMAEKAGDVGFDLVSIAPAYTFGHHPLAASVGDLMGSSNRVLLRVIAGGKYATPTPDPHKFMAAGVTLADVKKAVLLSLDLEQVKTPESGPEKAFSSYVLGTSFAMNEVFPIVARRWPEEVELGLLKGQGDWLSKKNVSIAMERFRKTFGFKFAGVEDMLDGIVPQYLELAKKEEPQSVEA